MQQRYRSNINIFIILLLIGITTVGYCNRALLVSLLTQGNDFYGDNNTLKTKNEQLPSFIEPAKDYNHNEQDVNDYSITNDEIANADNVEISENYYLFMQNLNSLVANFMQEKSCTQQLEKISVIKLPVNIQVIIDNISQYNTQYLNASDKDDNVQFIGKLKIFNKFFKITKKSLTGDKLNLKMLVLSNIEQLLNYFCSKTFKNQFIVR